MKTLVTTLLLGMLLVTPNAFAAITFDIQPSEMRIGCFKDTFYLGINKLASLTYSRTKAVGVKTNNPGLCMAAKQYIQSLGPTKGTVESKLDNADYPIKIFPCNLGMSSCKAIYRKSVIETIVVKINQVVLYNKAEVPGSRTDRVEEWDPKDCPPYKPDCDL